MCICIANNSAGLIADRVLEFSKVEQKNGSILYEDFELRNEVTVTFPMEGFFRKRLLFSFLAPMGP